MSGFRGGRRGGGARQAPKGLFQNGAWHCECNPRKPALHLQTKKEGANQGRWFYTCQLPMDDSKKCKFFLWDSDAKPREERALLNNSRTEPSHTDDTPSKRLKPSPPPPPYTPEAGPAQTTRKRAWSATVEEDDYGLDGDAAFNNELDQVVTAAETPSKVARIQSHTTPRRKLPWVQDGPSNGLATPQTERRPPFSDASAGRAFAPDVTFATPSRQSHREEQDAQILTPASSPFDTPTPSRFRDAGSARTKANLVSDVLNLLREENLHLKSTTETALRSLLNRHARIAEGYLRGQEVLKAQLKAKDTRITGLEHDKNTLQAELEAESEKTRYLKWELEQEEEG